MADTPHGDSSPALWHEEHSALFVDRGRVYTPGRDTIARTIVNFIPAATDEPFVGVDIGAGQGWLSDAILRQFPAARMIAVDGSPAMREAARTLLAPHAGRFDLRPFRLEDDAWLNALDQPIRCFVSCLVVHHLDGTGKRALFANLLRRLEPGGALLVADIIEPTSALARHACARIYDETVRQQSLAFTGSTEMYEQFVADEWNLFRHPDPELDKPSSVPEQLRWLAEAGYVGVDVFWALAGHALIGGYRPG